MVLAHAGRWPLFAPLSWIAPDGLHLATSSVACGRRLYGAPGRLDWSYALCIDQAMADVLPEWNQPPVGT